MTITTNSWEETQTAGAELAEKLLPDLEKKACVVLLSGELGAGKTTFTQGIATYLQTESTANSPSFTYIREQVFHVKQIEGKLIHCDFWRLNSENFAQLHFQNYLQAGNLIVIEWWQKLTVELLPLLMHAPIQLVEVRIREGSGEQREIDINFPA